MHHASRQSFRLLLFAFVILKTDEVWMQTCVWPGTGGGGDDDSSGQPSKGSRFSWPGWEARVAADPQFIYKVFVEQVRS